MAPKLPFIRDIRAIRGQKYLALGLVAAPPRYEPVLFVLSAMGSP